jgi:hypothetical protein
MSLGQAVVERIQGTFSPQAGMQGISNVTPAPGSPPEAFIREQLIAKIMRPAYRAAEQAKGVTTEAYRDKLFGNAGRTGLGKPVTSVVAGGLSAGDYNKRIAPYLAAMENDLRKNPELAQALVDGDDLRIRKTAKALMQLQTREFRRYLSMLNYKTGQRTGVRGIRKNPNAPAALEDAAELSAHASMQ